MDSDKIDAQIKYFLDLVSLASQAEEAVQYAVAVHHLAMAKRELAVADLLTKSSDKVANVISALAIHDGGEA